MTDLERLQAIRERIAAALDARAAAFGHALADVWRRLDRALPALVEKASGGSVSALVKAARAGRLRQEVKDALERAGWSDLVDGGTGASLDPVLLPVEQLRLVADIGAFTAEDATRIEALKALAAVDVLNEGEAVAAALWKATVQGVFSARPVEKILADLGTVLDKTAPQIRTLYDTSISVFAREAELVGTKPTADQAFVYTGPADLKVRPFCRQHLGKVYTRDRIDAMDNHQLPNVFLTCGGYNCRHAWTAVSHLSELAPLANTGRRVPELSRGIDDGDVRAA